MSDDFQPQMLSGWAEFEEACYREELCEFLAQRNAEQPFDRYYARKVIRRSIAAIRDLRAKAGADPLVNP